MKTLADLIGEPSDEGPKRDAFLSKFGMLRNPFPTARTILPQVMYNQDRALSGFATQIKDILGEQPEKRSLAIVGGTGGGKSHFLRHCEYLFEQYADKLSRPYFTVEFLVGSSSLDHLLREMLRQADEAAKKKGEYDLLASVIWRMKAEDDVGDVKQVDLRRVLTLLHRSTQQGFVPPDRDRSLTFDGLRDLAKKWLAGATLSQTERRYLGVFSRLGSASLMTRVITELFGLAYQLGVLGGGLVCLDEVETLFTGQLSAGKTQAFLQDLRYMVDESVRSGTGYSLMVMSASTPTGTTALRDFNYPLYQRLGYEGEQRIDLDPIKNLQEVRAFAQEYMQYEVKRAAESGATAKSSPSEFLTLQEYERAYNTAASASRDTSLRAQGSVNQAQLLEALHRIVEEKREAAI